MKFQSTLPREERRHSFKISRVYTRFQSTLPREERLTDKFLKILPTIFQSTLPREERLIYSLNCEMFSISIHAPTRGATLRKDMALSDTEYFNPRSHERSDTLVLIMLKIISIFQSTLPREERLSDKLIMTQNLDFNPRSHERSDYIDPQLGGVSSNFNPRSHERSDRLLMIFF